MEKNKEQFTITANTVVSALVVFVLVLSIFQNFQIQELKQKIESSDGGLSSVTTSGTSKAPSPSGQAAKQSNLPAMVGGC